ncbi:hypothetical protein Daus18300_005440 [Diaporthe australafricana]|uniref:Peptidase S8/S53 domain-containing protein n=1 Tax=Diaporthe australafricana TaxID=127596 RepID=A0ABR3X0U3_9PEZI
MERKAHSDEAIVECLKDLRVEIWEWKRMDIPAQVIIDACGDDVTTVSLFSSGLKAVLQSWADSRGLVNLSKLKKVYVEVHQGLESTNTIEKYIADFKTDLSEIYRKRWGRELDITYGQLEGSLSPGLGGEIGPSKIKNENEPGFKEQDWLKCMDEFADYMEYLENEPSTAPIKVALIDDGVKTSYAQLNRNVKSGWQQPRPRQSQTGKDPRTPYLNYNSSRTGHGTVMAYYIRRVCPNVQLHVAKLQPVPQQGDGAMMDNNQITFSLDSASEAIEWAVRERVHVICMSWAIDNTDSDKKKEQRLRKAITSAADENILLFCANPDRGEGYSENNTIPLRLDPARIFCIGAANQDGNPWARIATGDTSCDYYFPGVELGIQVVSSAKKNRGEPPKEWRKHSGSSLACALATGLAAMILHSSLVSGTGPEDLKWKELKTRDGMNRAFKAIKVNQPTDSKWVPVRRIFGEVLKYSGSSTKIQMEKLREIVVAEFIPRLSWGGSGPVGT